MSEVDSWYAACAQITSTRAKNFWWGIRLLEAEKRSALSAVYALARKADDIADGHLPPEEKLAGLKRLRTQLDRGQTEDPVVLAVRHAAMRLPIPLDAFGDLFDGCEADVQQRHYETWDEAQHYCRQVAGSIGRLSLGVFGSKDPINGQVWADALGIALQLTNILRDVREDRLNGRIYIPAEELQRRGLTLRLDPRGEFTDPREDLLSLYRSVSDRAQAWYDTGLRLVPTLDGRSRWCCGALTGIYRQLLRQIDTDPMAALRSRVSVPLWRKMAIVGAARWNR